MAPPTNFSLYHTLTNFSDHDHNALSFVKLLIRVLAHDVCSARRNNLTLYKIVGKARDNSNEIDRLIALVDQNDDDGAWEDYEKYTSAIDALEEFLLKLVLDVEAECTKFLPAGVDVKDVNDLIKEISDWKGKRGAIRQSVKQLQTKFLCVDKDDSLADARTAEEKHDDRTLLSTLCNGIISHSVDENIYDKRVKSSIDKLRSVAADINGTVIEPSLDASMEQVLTSLMLVYGALELPDETKVKDSAPVWLTAAQLLRDILGHLKRTPSFANAEQLTHRYKSLEELLKKLTAELPVEYLSLRRSVKAVGRPYLAQALVFISMARKLANHFKDGDNNKVSNLTPLKEALLETSKALEAASKACSSIGQFSESLKIEPAGEEFRAAKIAMQNCFVAYQLNAEWTTFETNLADALKKDKNRMKQFQEQFSSTEKQAKNTEPPKVPDVQIKIALPGDKSVTYIVNGKTRLSAIFWKYASESLLPDQVLERSYFAKNAGGPERLAMDVQVSTLQDNGKLATVYLVNM